MEPRVPLFERLPEIYKIEDEAVEPAGQLREYLGVVEGAFEHLHANIEGLYDDLFIETCDAWVIPYLGDLLGTSHLSGDPWTLRADVADTIALRRRKGTLAGIERLTFVLTKWGVRAVELRERLVWNQHLNHQRPDQGGEPAYGNGPTSRFTPIRGGTLTLRDPALLSLLRTPFDPFAHVVDVKPGGLGALRHNLPNLAIFLWRLEDYRVVAAKPVHEATVASGGVQLVQFHVHPLGEPLRLFNKYQFDPTLEPPVITSLDATPGPIPTARLSERSEAGNPDAYFAVDVYDEADASTATRDLKDVGLQLHVPASAFPGRSWLPGGAKSWRVRGENLCAWDSGLLPPLQLGDVAVDPEHGRIMIAVADATEAAALEADLLVTHTYGAVGPVGAHPTTRAEAPEPWDGAEPVEVDLHADPGFTLEHALANIHTLDRPLIIEIRDSLTHDFDIEQVAGRISQGGGFNLRLNAPVLIRAADGQRPVVRLKKPLRFRPFNVAAAGNLILRLDGLYLTRHPVDFPAGDALIMRAALDRLELVGCTLDPGGSLQLDGTEHGTRSDIRNALALQGPKVGFSVAERANFRQTPEIVLRRTVTGPLRIDDGYRLALTESVLDAGCAESAPPPPLDQQFAVSALTDPDTSWGPPAEVDGVTVLGRMRVARINGRGGIWVRSLEVHNNQEGCIKFSYFSGVDDRLPQNLGCVKGSDDVGLSFVDERFGRPGYAQLSLTTARTIREDGPRGHEMGAFGFLEEAHKWRNLQIRFREFMPVGIRPLLIPVT